MKNVYQWFNESFHSFIHSFIESYEWLIKCHEVDRWLDPGDQNLPINIFNELTKPTKMSINTFVIYPINKLLLLFKVKKRW